MAVPERELTRGRTAARNARPALLEETSRIIDDVDRCEPEAAYRLLEGLKIYLTLDNCVFVLGMNQKAVEEAIKKRMGTEDEYPSVRAAEHSAQAAERTAGSAKHSARAAAYMEKLCQNVWHLPAIRESEEALFKFLEKTVVNETFIGRTKRAIERYACLPPNPRRLKGLANVIGRFSSRLPETINDEEAIVETRLLIIVAYIYQFRNNKLSGTRRFQSSSNPNEASSSLRSRALALTVSTTSLE